MDLDASSGSATAAGTAAGGPRRWSTLVLPGAVAAAGLTYLYGTSPYAESALLLPCPLKALTGLSCPFCGATRMSYALLHGDVAAAWAVNPFLLLAVPLVLAALLWRERQARVQGRVQDRRLSAGQTRVLLAAVLTWGCARNLVPAL